MMRCAKALTIVDIKGLATILKLNDVVGIHTMLRPSPAAPVPMVDGLTPTTSTGHDLRTPDLELGCGVDRIRLPEWQLGGASGEDTDKRGEGAQLGHA